MSINLPNTSYGRRKSVNWAHPLSTASTQFKMSTIKRSSARFKGNKAPAINIPFSKIIQTDAQTANNLEKKIDNCAGKCAEPSEENKAICVIAYCRTKVSGPKSKGPGASWTKPQLEPKCYSKDGSNSRMHKRARIVREEQLHGDSSIESGKGWVSVPLHKREGEKLRDGERTLSEPDDKSSFKVLSNEPAKMTSVEHTVVVNKKSEMEPLNEQLHGDSSIKAGKGWISVPLDNMKGEKSRNPDRTLPEADKSHFKVLSDEPAMMTSLERTFILNQKSRMETMSETVDKELREAHARSKKVVHDLEQTIAKRRENKLQKLQLEKAKIKAIAALQQEKLRNEITLQSQKHSKIIEEKLAIERDRDALKKDFSSKVEKELDSYRLKMDRDHAKIVATLTRELGREQEKSQSLTMELSKEQEKNCCQICFTSPRDAIVLPCLHFEYCNECLREHQRRQTECPTCRAKIIGVIRSNFFAS